MNKKDKLINDGILILNNLNYISCTGDKVLECFLDSKVDQLYSEWLKNIKNWLKENGITQSQSYILFMSDTEFFVPYHKLLEGNGFAPMSSHKEDCLKVVEKCTKGVENKIEELKKINIDESVSPKEHNKSNKDKILYKFRYDRVNGVTINNISLGKPRLDSESDILMLSVYERPNIVIKKEDIQGSIKRSFTQLVAEVGFKGGLKDLFFPSVSNSAVMLINPVTEEYLKKNNLLDLVDLDIKKLIEDTKKKRNS